jgi:uncharacterized iron-regulated protein
MLALTACCTACGIFESSQNGFQLPVPDTAANAEFLPQTIDPIHPQAIETLIDRLADKRVLFIGEIHDHVEHHQNQLRIIQSLYARYPDFAIGVEYFQQPFQQYLDDYIAGRINEQEMLKKTEYFKRWKLDYRMLRPIFQFARENHIPILALNVTDEIHNKVFKGGMKNLSLQERAQIPARIKPANKNYLQRLKSIFDSHPQADSFEYFVDGVLLWDEAMADTTVRYLNSHPQSRVVVLAGLVHILYGDGIPERVNHRLGNEQSLVTVNGGDFAQFPNISDYVLTTETTEILSSPGKLGITLIDDQDSMHVSDFAPASPAKVAGIEMGDHIVSLNGMKVASVAELKTIMFDKQPNDHVQVTVLRDHFQGMREELQFEVKLY